jgi:hypothetical protein
MNCQNIFSYPISGTFGFMILKLDKAVDLAYRPQIFTTEANRMEYLFELYDKYTTDLFTREKAKKTKKYK